MAQQVQIKKTHMYLVIIVIMAIGIFIFMKPTISGNAVSEDGVQKVIVSMKNYQYSPNTYTVKAGMPVELSLDKSVVGCFRDLEVVELGITKYLSTPQDTIKFTPTKTGELTFGCSMGMGYGKIIVK